MAVNDAIENHLKGPICWFMTPSHTYASLFVGFSPAVWSFMYI